MTPRPLTERAVLAFIAISLILLMILCTVGYIYFSHRHRTKPTNSGDTETTRFLLDDEFVLDTESDS